MSVCLQQHARIRSGASGRLLDRPSGHEPVQREQQVLFQTIHIANIESAHATADRALVRGRACETFEWMRAAPSPTLWSCSRRQAVTAAVDLPANASEMMVETAPAAMGGGGQWLAVAGRGGDVGPRLYPRTAPSFVCASLRLRTPVQCTSLVHMQFLRPRNNKNSYENTVCTQRGDSARP